MGKGLVEYPKQFTENILNTWGIKGKKWLQNLPNIVEHCIQKWNLKNLSIAKNLFFNYVAFAEIDRGKVVLKLSFPGSEINQEIKVLKYFNGHGTTKLYDYDLENAAMLLEAIVPGTPLSTLFPNQDQESMIIFAKVMKKLHSKPLAFNELASSKTASNELALTESEFPTLNKWLSSLYSEHKEIPNHLLKKAQKLSEYLLETQENPILLHGDLHQDNILQNVNSWISIDPKGVLGEPCYEVGAFIRNPMPKLIQQSNLSEIMANRFATLSALLDIEKSRLMQWSFVQSILAACWCLEDNTQSWNDWIICAEVILNQL